MTDLRVEVHGMRDLRRRLRDLDRGTLKEVQANTKRAADIVARGARPLAPVRTGRLAASYRATTRGDKGIVRSRLPYAAVHEYGGTIRPRGTDIKIEGRRAVLGALERERPRVVAQLARGMQSIIDREGLG